MLNYSHIHLIGAGGMGTAPLFRLINDAKISVTGSDLEENKNTAELKKDGFKIFIGHSAENVPDTKKGLIIYSSAVKTDNPEIIEAEKKSYSFMKRGVFFAKFAEKSRFLVCPEKYSSYSFIKNHPNLKTVKGFEKPEDYQLLNTEIATAAAEIFNISHEKSESL